MTDFCRNQVHRNWLESPHTQPRNSGCCGRPGEEDWRSLAVEWEWDLEQVSRRRNKVTPEKEEGWARADLRGCGVGGWPEGGAGGTGSGLGQQVSQFQPQVSGPVPFLDHPAPQSQGSMRSGCGLCRGLQAGPPLISPPLGPGDNVENWQPRLRRSFLFCSSPGWAPELGTSGRVPITRTPVPALGPRPRSTGGEGPQLASTPGTPTPGPEMERGHPMGCFLKPYSKTS